MCQPILNDGTDCNNPLNVHQYIEEFTCSNPEATDKIIKDMRMSFPSANSSFSFFTMVFSIVSTIHSLVIQRQFKEKCFNSFQLYLHYRFDWKGSYLVKYFLQFVFLMMAWFTSLSRISDYKHHCK